MKRGACWAGQTSQMIYVLTRQRTRRTRQPKKGHKNLNNIYDTEVEELAWLGPPCVPNGFLFVFYDDYFSTFLRFI